MRISSFKFQVSRWGSRSPCIPPSRRRDGTPNVGFSLVEILVVSALLALIVIALMGVFSSTQRAFRASVTQTGVLEGGRAATDLIASDVARATPAYDKFFTTAQPFQSLWNPQSAVNFFVATNTAFYQPLVQSLPGSSSARTNQLQWFFVLSRQNTEWIGVGYIVNTSSTNYFYPLYRFYEVANTTVNPAMLYSNFVYDVNAGCINMSHVLDGVVHLVVRAYDPNGIWVPNGYFGTSNSVANTYYTTFEPVQEPSFMMVSNALPASVEVQLGVMEDRAVARCQAMRFPQQAILNVDGSVPPVNQALWNYLPGLAGRVHVFRQRVTIENVDPTIYQ